MGKWKKKEMKNFGRHVIKKQRFCVCSVFNYYKTNAKSVVFESTAVTNKINTVFVKKRNYDFLAPKPRFFEKKKRKSKKKGMPV